MANYRVTCITTPHVDGTHNSITHIGNSIDQWTVKIDEAIVRINSKRDAFYVQDDVTGKINYLTVVNEEGEKPYLRVHADGHYNDSLLTLNQCYID